MFFCIAQSENNNGKGAAAEEVVDTNTIVETKVLTDEELVAAVRKQIEYYFGKENLQQDSFLTSHMDINNSVPLAFILKVRPGFRFTPFLSVCLSFFPILRFFSSFFLQTSIFFFSVFHLAIF